MTANEHIRELERERASARRLGSRLAPLTIMPHVFGEFMRRPDERLTGKRERYTPCEVCGNPCRSKVCKKCADNPPVETGAS